MKTAVVLGAGITGLAAGWRLAEKGYRVTVVERSDNIGGLAATFRHGEFLLDYGPHKIYTQLPVMDEFRKLMGNRLITVSKSSRVRLRGKYFNFPISTKEMLFKLPVLSIQMGLSYARALITRKTDLAYEDYLRTRFGDTTYRLVFKPYAEKIWGKPKELSSDMAATRVAAPSLLEVIKRVIFGDQGKAELSATTFFYPRKGVIQMSEMFAERLAKKKGKILLSSLCTGLTVKKGKITSVTLNVKGKQQKLKPDVVVSTIPLPILLNLLSPTSKDAVGAAKRLMLKDLSLLYIVVNKPRLFNDNWLFFPEKSYVFNRISEQKGFSKEMGPAGKTVLAVEITHPDWVNKSDQELFDKAVGDLERARILKRNDVAEWFIKRIPKVYQIYDIDYKHKLETIFGFLDGVTNLYSIGRNGAFSYCGTMDGIDMAFKTGDFVSAGKARADWIPLRKTFYDYKVID
jgi:protoporphyrinogen oxidase